MKEEKKEAKSSFLDKLFFLFLKIGKTKNRNKENQ